MNELKNPNSPNHGLKLLERAALASAHAGANSFCVWLFHNPKKPEALNKLKKF